MFWYQNINIARNKMAFDILINSYCFRNIENLRNRLKITLAFDKIIDKHTGQRLQKLHFNNIVYRINNISI